MTRLAARLMCLAAAFALLALGPGCKKEHCDKLVALACDHVADKDDSIERCERLKEQAETVEDEECLKIMKLLKESGKIQSETR